MVDYITSYLVEPFTLHGVTSDDVIPMWPDDEVLAYIQEKEVIRVDMGERERIKAEEKTDKKISLNHLQFEGFIEIFDSDLIAVKRMSTTRRSVRELVDLFSGCPRIRVYDTHDEVDFSLRPEQELTRDLQKISEIPIRELGILKSMFEFYLGETGLTRREFYKHLLLQKHNVEKVKPLLENLARRINYVK